MFVYHGYIITQKPPIPYKGKLENPPLQGKSQGCIISESES